MQSSSAHWVRVQEASGAPARGRAALPASPKIVLGHQRPPPTPPSGTWLGCEWHCPEKANPAFGAGDARSLGAPRAAPGHSGDSWRPSGAWWGPLPWEKQQLPHPAWHGQWKPPSLPHLSASHGEPGGLWKRGPGSRPMAGGINHDQTLMGPGQKSPPTPGPQPRRSMSLQPPGLCQTPTT